MSWRTTTWAFDQRGLKPTDKIVLLALADWANDDGECYPGQRTIAEKCDLSERTVRDVLHRLEAQGLIESEDRRRPDGYKTSKMYRLILSPAESAGKTSPAESDDLTGRIAQSYRQTVAGQEPPVEPPVEPESAYALSAREPIPAGAFSQFWDLWPRKVGKRNAEAAFKRATSRCSIVTILIAARRYAENPNLPETQFIPHPTTWLNRDGWADELPGPRSKNGGKEAPDDRALRILNMGKALEESRRQEPEQRAVNR